MGVSPKIGRLPIYGGELTGMVYSLFSQTGDTQNLLAKIAITLESYKIVE